MYLYAKYCPVAATTKVMGDFWTPLIVRELLYGTTRFNQLARNVPGIPRSVLAGRLRNLERARLVVCERGGQRTMTAYCLTPAGRDLRPVLEAMDVWGTRWAAPEPPPEEVDPLIMICMLKSRMRVAELPEERVVLEVQLTGDQEGRAWVVSERRNVTMCFDPPGFDTDLWVTSDIPTLYDIWRGRSMMADALARGAVEVDGRAALLRCFARWFDGTDAGPRRGARSSSEAAGIAS